MNQTELQLIGGLEAGKILRRMGQRYGRRTTLKIVREAGKTYLNEARKNAPVGPTGNLRRGIKMKTEKGMPPRVSVRPDYNIAPHAHLVEFGTQPHGVGKGGEVVTVQHPGAKPNPFLRRSWDRTKGRVERMLKAGVLRVLHGGFA